MSKYANKKKKSPFVSIEYSYDFDFFESKDIDYGLNQEH